MLLHVFASKLLLATENAATFGAIGSMVLIVAGALFAHRIHHWLACPFYGRLRTNRLEASWCDPTMRGLIRTQCFGLVLLSSLVLLAELLTEITRRWASTTIQIDNALAHTTCVVAVTFGLSVCLLGASFFKKTRGRNARRWHAKGGEGLQVVDFMPAFDHPDKDIYASCRGSRRLAAAMASKTMVAAGCFALSGMIATQVIRVDWMSQVILYASVAAILSLWPTSGRTVAWCRNVVRKEEPTQSQEDG